MKNPEPVPLTILLSDLYWSLISTVIAFVKIFNVAFFPLSSASKYWVADSVVTIFLTGSIAVISGEGVKGYYEKNGYKEVDTFMIKDFKLWQHLYINFYKIISILIIIIAYVLILSYF